MHNFYESTWEKERDKRYLFPVVCDSEMKNMTCIHPLQQRHVDAIFRAICGNSDINMIVIFGSSLNMRCTSQSDIDLAVKLKEGRIADEIKNKISEIIQTACDWKADILWRDRLEESDRVMQHIRKGVILVEQTVKACESETS